MRFLGQVVKKGNFGHPPKNKKCLTDNWKAHFLIFFCFFFVLFNFFFVFCCFCFLLGPKPSLFFVCLFFLGGGCFLFPFFASEWQKTSFPLKKGIFCLLLSVSLCFSWAFFGLPLVQFLFLCLSLSLSLSLSCSFLSFFLLVFLFLLYFGSFFSLFLSFSVFFAFVSWKLTTSKDSIAKFFFINPVSFFGFLSCFLFQIPFSYLCFFLVFSYAFCSTSMFLVSKNTSWKTPIFGQKGSCNKTGFL